MGYLAPDIFARAAETLEEIAAVQSRLGRDQLALPSVLPGWRVADLLAHCHEATDFLVAGARSYAGHAAGDDPGHAWTASRRLRAAGRAVETLRPDAAAAVYGSAPMPFGTFVDIVAFELAAHHRDLVWSLGCPVPLDSVAAAAVLRVFGAHLARIGAAQPAPAHPMSFALHSLDGEFQVTACFDGRSWVAHGRAAGHVAITGPDHALAALLLGRIEATDPWLAVSGDVATALTFGRWFPGPQ